MTAKMPLDWDWLRDLLALARAGSIETAAGLDGVDPTTLLRRLRRLEKLAGRRLLVRKGRSLILSSAGHDFVATAEAVEQVLIEAYELNKNGGSLLNKINSIAKSNPDYAAALQRGAEILERIGYKP